MNVQQIKKKSSYFVEKRKFRRLDHSLDVHFKIVSGSDETMTSRLLSGLTRNISCYGICLETNTIQVDGFHCTHDSLMVCTNKLDIEISVSDDINIKAFGEVSWYNSVPHGRGHRYMVGIYFSDISEEDLLKIKKIIH